MTKNPKGSGKGEGNDWGFGGFLGGLTDLVEKLNELATTAKDLKGSGEIPDFGPGKQFKGVYGFNVRVGLGKEQDKVKVEPFGNIHRDKESGRTVVQEVREPLVDVFEEDDHTLVVAEMPGISEKDLKLSVTDDVLTISGERGEKKYYREILLPRKYVTENIEVSCNNGMIEIKCRN